MKVAFVTDIHLQEKKLDGPMGHRALLLKVADEIIESGAEVCLIGGDSSGLHVPHKATIGERNALLDFVVKVSISMPVVKIRGNHDSEGDWEFLCHTRGFADRRPRHPVIYTEKVEVLEFSAFRVITMPWRNESAFPSGVSWEAGIRDEYSRAVKSVQPDDPKPTLALIHGAFAGAFIREGQPTIPTADPVLRLDSVLDPDRVTAGFVGHYHTYQKIPGQVPTYYGGSLFISQFGEDNEKGWVLWTPEHGHRLHRLEQPAKVKLTIDPRTSKVDSVQPPVLPWVGRTTNEIAGLLNKKKTGGHEIKISFEATEATAKAFQADLQHLTHALSEAGTTAVVEAKIERGSNMRTGARAVAKARTMVAKFEAWAKQLTPQPDPETLERAVSMLKKEEGHA